MRFLSSVLSLSFLVAFLLCFTILGTVVTVGEGRPSKHLAWTELECHDAARTAYPQEFCDDGRCAKLCEAFESLRAHLGGVPLRVTSAYRTAEHQKRVNPRAKRSYHVRGMALDIAVPKGYTTWTFHDAVGEWARGYDGVGAVGYYPRFVHVDVRSRVNGRLVSWASDRKLKP